MPIDRLTRLTWFPALAAALAVVATAEQAKAAPRLDWTAIDGTLLIGGEGGSRISAALTPATPGGFSRFSIPDQSSINASFSDTGADGAFSANAPDGSADIDLEHEFSPLRDALATISWDYTEVTPTEAAVNLSLIDASDGSSLFTASLGASAPAGSQSLPVSASTSYVWSFSGTITSRNAGAASAAIALVPEPAALVGGLAALSALLGRQSCR